MSDNSEEDLIGDVSALGSELNRVLFRLAQVAEYGRLTTTGVEYERFRSLVDSLTSTDQAIRYIRSLPQVTELLGETGERRSVLSRDLGDRPLAEVVRERGPARARRRGGNLETHASFYLDSPDSYTALLTYQCMEAALDTLGMRFYSLEQVGQGSVFGRITASFKSSEAKEQIKDAAHEAMLGGRDMAIAKLQAQQIENDSKRAAAMADVLAAAGDADIAFQADSFILSRWQVPDNRSSRF